MEETKKLTDPEILEMLLGEIHESANSLSIKLNYNSPSTVYHIINGINTLSESFATRVIAKYPQVNFMFLMKGELPVLLEKSESQGQANVMYDGPSFNDLPKILKNIEDLLRSIDSKLPGVEEENEE